MANAETKPQGRVSGLEGYRLLSTVVSRAYVALEHGRLIIKPTSGKSVPSEWLAQNKQALLAQIATLTNQPLYSYVGYSTIAKPCGVAVRFAHIDKPVQAFAIYNAERRYQRGRQKGKLRPQGHFGAGERSKFYSFWMRTGLPLPRRLTVFHEVMGRLSHLYFTLDGELKAGGDIEADKDSVQAANVSYETIKQALELQQFFNKSSTTLQQEFNNELQQESGQSHTGQGLAEVSGTGAGKCGNTLIRYHGNTGAIPSSTTGTGQANQQIQDQSMDEWLAAYDSYHIP